MDMKKNIKNRLHTIPFIVCLMTMSVVGLTSCEDFFEQDSSYVVFEEDNYLNNAADTIYSVVGVLNKLQAVADRTILLGEVRGDLVDVTDATHADLRKVAAFDIDEDNKYNSPRDYYAIINNCNYFIANVDTSVINNRNEKIFLREYVAIKGFRAWAYLQLALNYGSVPFIDKPILSKEESEKGYPLKGIKEICNYFIDDLMPLADEKLPSYGNIRGLDSRLFYFPIYLLLGELNLWAENYEQAALNYYKYINTRNGMNSAYPIGRARIEWYDSEWESLLSSDIGFNSESYSAQSELITMIPGDSIPSEGYYSELRNLFNSTTDNEYKVSLVPSAALQKLSAAQRYCYIEISPQGEKDTIYAPENIIRESSSSKVSLNGDLRLWNVWELDDEFTNKNGERVDYQTILKYSSRNVHIYRKTMLYLRMAEALNRAGYPVFAYKILSSGVNNKVIQEEVMSCYRTPADSAFLRQFDFPDNRYGLVVPTQSGTSTAENINTMGIHSRGSGWSSANKYYQVDTTLTVEEQILQVEDMIVDEGALEFAFEGIRFYDLMRVALRRNDADYLAERVALRSGVEDAALRIRLQDYTNWYLYWNWTGLEIAE
jgi:hypothetical protein